jgi:hypothetical protein
LISVAQDTGGESAAGEFYDAAKASYTTLIDTEHSISSLYHMTNVPSGVWINEDGRMVRPVEPASTASKTLTLGDKAIHTMGDVYISALRDWVEKGESSKFAMTPEQLRQHLKPRQADEQEADASFRLGVYFYKTGQRESAEKYWQHAQKLHPESWNYHRQEWFFTPEEQNKKWYAKFLQLGDEPYYPSLQMQDSSSLK